MDKEEIRRAALRELVRQWDSATSLAGAIGHANGSYIGHLLKARKPFTERTARDIEAKLSLPNGWMDQPREQNSGPAAPLDTQMLERVVALTVAAVKSNPLPPAKLTAILVEVYTSAMKSGRVDQAQINRLLDLTK